MQIFNKCEHYACINEHIFENLYGEKPHRDETKWNRDVVLNSYNYFLYLNPDLISSPRRTISGIPTDEGNGSYPVLSLSFG